jgi:hypothetical protein
LNKLQEPIEEKRNHIDKLKTEFRRQEYQESSEAEQQTTEKLIKKIKESAKNLSKSLFSSTQLKADAKAMVRMCDYLLLKDNSFSRACDQFASALKGIDSHQNKVTDLYKQLEKHFDAQKTLTNGMSNQV